VDESLNGVSSPLEGSPSHPYIESGGQVTYREVGSPDPSSGEPGEGETSKLGWQSIMSCLGVIVHPGMS
jgi:hypothetical protein